MAWISVDQRLLGGKLRTLYKALGCSQNEAIGILINLWLWGLDNAEPDGFIQAADKEDIANVIRSGLTDNLDPLTVVDRLIENRWLDEDDSGLFLHDWTEWRSYYNKWKNNKEKNAERQARFKERHKKDVDVTGNVTGSVISNVTNNNEKEESKTKKRKRPSQSEKYTEEFEVFWKVYPNSKNKAGTFECYKTRRKEFSAEDLLRAAKNYAVECTREKTDMHYILHGSTFLGPKLRFLDYLPSEDYENREEALQSRIEDGANPFRR